jgi:hypothetical protein
VHSIESASLSRCSSRHAANPWLTKKAGKQEAKEDDEEREIELHGVSGVFGVGCAAGPSAAFGRLTRERGSCQVVGIADVILSGAKEA